MVEKVSRSIAFSVTVNTNKKCHWLWSSFTWISPIAEKNIN